MGSWEPKLPIRRYPEKTFTHSWRELAACRAMTVSSLRGTRAGPLSPGRWALPHRPYPRDVTETGDRVPKGGHLRAVSAVTSSGQVSTRVTLAMVSRTGPVRSWRCRAQRTPSRTVCGAVRGGRASRCRVRHGMSSSAPMPRPAAAHDGHRLEQFMHSKDPLRRGKMVTRCEVRKVWRPRVRAQARKHVSRTGCRRSTSRMSSGVEGLGSKALGRSRRQGVRLRCRRGGHWLALVGSGVLGRPALQQPQVGLPARRLRLRAASKEGVTVERSTLGGRRGGPLCGCGARRVGGPVALIGMPDLRPAAGAARLDERAGSAHPSRGPARFVPFRRSAPSCVPRRLAAPSRCRGRLGFGLCGLCCCLGREACVLEELERGDDVIARLDQQHDCQVVLRLRRQVGQAVLNFGDRAPGTRRPT